MTTEQIIKAFKQGKTGNCVSIAVIKAGIQVFGVGNVVLFQPTDAGKTAFFMKDGFEGELSPEEIVQAKAGSLFQCLESQEIFDYANLCFASMAKRALAEKPQELLTFADAIKELNDGEDYRNGPDLLGLRHYERAVGLKFVWNNIGVVGASRKHCFFCSNGIVDNYGRPDNITLIERPKYAFYKYYRIAKEPIY
jgi:hypothetical protein